MDNLVQVHVASVVVHGGPHDEKAKIVHDLLTQVRGRLSLTLSLIGDLSVQPAQSVDNSPKR
jgi:hypothetical protein